MGNIDVVVSVYLNKKVIADENVDPILLPIDDINDSLDCTADIYPLPQSNRPTFEDLKEIINAQLQASVFLMVPPNGRGDGHPTSIVAMLTGPAGDPILGKDVVVEINKELTS